VTWQLIAPAHPLRIRPDPPPDTIPVPDGRSPWRRLLAGLAAACGGRTPPAVCLPAAERDRLLYEAGAALRVGRLDEVRSLLSEAGRRTAGDAACLNLRGVVCEARGRPTAAKRYYGRAIRADAGFGPAQQNMRRLYELATLGRSSQPVAVGDGVTDVWLAPRTGGRAADRRD